MTALFDMNRAISKQMGSKLNRFCSPLVDTLGISHFYHYMLTDDGYHASVGTNQGWHDCLFSGTDCYKALPHFRNMKSPRGRILFTQAVENVHWKKLARIAKEDFHVNLGLQVAIQTEEGQETFGFGLKSADPYQHMALLNRMPLLQLFIGEYRQQFGNAFLRDHLVDVASLVGPSFFETGESTPSLLREAYFEAPAPFTKKENEVIRHLLNGYSAPKIAEKLSRSTRTIEHHLGRIKDKLDCPSKSDLIQKIRQFEAMGYHFF